MTAFVLSFSGGDTASAAGVFALVFMVEILLTVLFTPPPQGHA